MSISKRETAMSSLRLLRGANQADHDMASNCIRLTRAREIGSQGREMADGERGRGRGKRERRETGGTAVAGDRGGLRGEVW